MSTESPLVSVIVITYNSSKYVLETLESIKVQTYQNIELIITDDCSKDNTIEICRKWIDKNKEYFTNTQIVTSDHNTGVSANCNRGYKAAKGEWIKAIAGDDALYPTAIKNYISFSLQHPEAQIIHANVHLFNNVLDQSHIIKKKPIYPACFTTIGPKAEQQFKLLCITNFIYAPTVFIRNELFHRMNFFDESIPMCEDWPMWLKISRLNIPFYFLNSYTIKYRVTDQSIYGKENTNYLFKRFFTIDNTIYKNYIKPFAPTHIKALNRYDYFLRHHLDYLGLNKTNKITKGIYKLFNIPYWTALRLMIKSY